jgi:uncharacterized MAPEG superfamily protein
MPPHSMPIPLLTLLGFAFWTLLILMITVGVHRWSHILTRRATIASFPADASNGPDWYKRGTRAHANCVENLPVYAVIVFASMYLGVSGRWVDVLSVAVLAARVVQSSVHICFVQTDRAVSVRFSFYSVQLVAMLVMLVMLAGRA